MDKQNRKAIIAGNWKMNKTATEAAELIDALIPAVKDAGCEVVICVPFTDLVDQAWQQGLTEPDPRVDLSGKDVMRKLVILAREAGYDIEPDQVRVESLVPAHCEEGSVDHFFENGEELNEQMLQRLEAAREMGLVLRYVARFDANGKARVGVEAVREEHPLAALLPCDNVFAIESRWYRDNPLVIRGPGAGRDVTAGAIQSDINRLAQLL